ncbi:hypothetical protein J4E80_009809 [Alternaria sp. BMP 0032]|nr:hypothetical protein J4E80_009809 [Alternaria sp. BMP 0032]
MRFGIPPYDGDDEDSSAYTLLIGFTPGDNFTFYEKKTPGVGQSDDVLTVKNIEAGESQEGKEGENEKTEEDECPTEDSEAEEDDSEGLQSSSEPEDFVDMRMNLIYECSHWTDTAFRVRMFGCVIRGMGWISRMVLQSHLQARFLVVAGSPLPGDISAQRSSRRLQGLVPS